MSCVPSDIIGSVVSTVTVAGEYLISEFSRPDGIRGSDDKALVDVEIEHVLREKLLDIFQCDFWGEETGCSLTGNPWCWVVDPNDGTSDFLRGLQGSAISVGLLHDAVPVLGVVYAPLSPDRGKDCIAWAEGMPSILRNGRPVNTDLSQHQLGVRSTVFVSAAAVSKPVLNEELCAPGRFHAMPSIAYRLARVAAGDGVCAVSLYPVAAHDVVAGHALLRASKGSLLDQDGNLVLYDTCMTVVSQRCFGGAPAACRTLSERDWGKLVSHPA